MFERLRARLYLYLVRLVRKQPAVELFLIFI